MNITVTQKEYDALVKWQKAFNKAGRIKHLAWCLRYKIPDATLDKRVKFAWQYVKNLEPFPTFENGTLTGKASMLLNLIKIKQILPNIKQITIQ